MSVFGQVVRGFDSRLDNSGSIPGVDIFVLSFVFFCNGSSGVYNIIIWCYWIMRHFGPVVKGSVLYPEDPGSIPGDTIFFAFAFFPSGRTWRMLIEAWPRC